MRDKRLKDLKIGIIGLGMVGGTLKMYFDKMDVALKEMKRRSLRRGLVSACVGGGQGGAVLLERS